MKMNAGLIIGILVILFGISLILKAIFHIDFPIFKIVIALFLIYLGIKMLIGNFHFGYRGHSHGSTAVFSDTKTTGCEGDEFNAVFGKITIDLRDCIPQHSGDPIEVNAVFGGAEIIVNQDAPVKIKADAVFGGVDLPVGGAGGFGSTVYKSESYNENNPYIYVKANAVFGGIEIRRF